MKKIVLGIASALIFLTIVDAATTFWAVSIGFREVNPLLHPLAHTYWVFPVMIVPTAVFGVFFIRWAERIPRVWAMLLTAGLLVWMVLLVKAIIHNSQLISIFA